MEWTAETIDRLYKLHRRYVDSLRRDVIQVNRSLGSTNPTKTALGYLTRAQFESLLKAPSDDPESVRLWIRRIVRGNEDKFPEFHAAG